MKGANFYDPLDSPSGGAGLGSAISGAPGGLAGTFGAGAGSQAGGAIDENFQLPQLGRF